MTTFRQGDVLLLSVNAIPDGQAVPRDGGRLVLAYGEAMAHASILASDAAFTHAANMTAYDAASSAADAATSTRAAAFSAAYAAAFRASRAVGEDHAWDYPTAYAAASARESHWQLAHLAQLLGLAA